MFVLLTWEIKEVYKYSDMYECPVIHCWNNAVARQLLTSVLTLTCTYNVGVF